MTIRKLILNGEEQYTHILPMINIINNLPEDAQNGEMFLTMDDNKLMLLVFNSGDWWGVYLSDNWRK